ncbi:hypothetical protein HanHA300_Chr13g0499581 [Helianthus annuus]|nr:hypothetical protein HanHA300_Chr13g0499581 [Helianthus annuus]
MMAGAEIVCSEVVCKVEEERCGSSVYAVGGVATVDCIVVVLVLVVLMLMVKFEQFKKEGLTVDPLVSETNGVVHGAMAVSVIEVSAVKTV